MKKFVIVILFPFLVWSCGTNSKQEENNTPSPAKEMNPAAEGFDQENSDPKAIAIADKVMLAMGGRTTWDTTNIIAWTFFERRHLIWNKKTGDVFIDIPSDSLQIKVNIHSKVGKVKKAGNWIHEETTAKDLVQRGYRMWINDSYWLVMPFKLKDSGVTLTYSREDTTAYGEPCDVVELNFKSVGVTPQNKYEIFVSKNNNLVKQWAFFAESSQDSANYIWPFDNYKSYNGLMLSAERSDNKGPYNVQVFQELDSAAYPRVF